LKENTLKTASDMEIGEGGTNVWYLGGIAQNNAECIILSHSELASSENREKVIFCFILEWRPSGNYNL